MKSIAAPLAALVIALVAGNTQAAEPAAPGPLAGETPDQKCARWADHQGLKDQARTEYIKDCLLDLRVPDKKKDQGDD